MVHIVYQFFNFGFRRHGVRLTAAVLHDVADKRLNRLFLAVFVVLNRLGIALDGSPAQLEQRVVVNAAHIAFADEFKRALAAVEHFFKRGLGEVVADLAAVEQLDKLVELSGRNGYVEDLLVRFGLDSAENLTDDEVGNGLGRLYAVYRLVEVFAYPAVLRQQRRVLFGDLVIVDIALEFVGGQLGHFALSSSTSSRGMFIVTRSGSRK